MKMELLTLLVKLGILLITGFLAPAFRAWLEAHAEDARIERIKGYARQAVRAAEQMQKQIGVEDPTGDTRKKRAIRFLMEACRRIGIELSTDEIEELVEAAVYELNKEKQNDIN